MPKGRKDPKQRIADELERRRTMPTEELAAALKTDLFVLDLLADPETLDAFECDWLLAYSSGEVGLYRRRGWHLGTFAHGVWPMARTRRGTGGTFSSLPTLTLPLSLPGEVSHG